MNVRTFQPTDLNRVLQVWNDSVEAGEVVYSPMTEKNFQQKFLSDPNFDPGFALVAEKDDRVIGFIIGIINKVFLPKETNENTPGYITSLFVEKESRGQGIGTALLDALTAKCKAIGKSKMACSGHNPIKLDWIVPGTDGHDHNNAPGMDEDCMGHDFLLCKGYQDTYREVAMYLDLKDYKTPGIFTQKRAELKVQGIYTGRYDVSLGYDFDGMCDRVGSEYWRKVLQDETSSPNPRPILVATHEKAIIGFTGPVDKQPSGRGWFTGICTDPLYERRGIAFVLFNLLLQEFVAEGAVFSTLFTGDGNHAKKLYLRLGYSIVRRYVVMEKAI